MQTKQYTYVHVNIHNMFRKAFDRDAHDLQNLYVREVLGHAARDWKKIVVFT